MSSPLKEGPVQSQAAGPPNYAETSHRATPAKRCASGDEIQFISSNPVKQRRMTEQKPAPTALARHPSPSHNTQFDRCHSIGTAGHPRCPNPDALLENRGTSLPTMENFAFPQSFPPPSTQPLRLSETVSPKQLPKAPPSSSGADMNPNRPVSDIPDLPLQSSVTLDQISCLDCNGVPTNTPGFDAGLSADGCLLSAVRLATAAPPAQVLPPLDLMTNHSAIPFTMYSTGNILPMAQTQFMSQPPAPFAHMPMQDQPQHNGMSVAGAIAKPPTQHPVDHQNNQSQLPVSHTTHSRSFSRAPSAKPPCLQCARIRQESVLRRVQRSPPLPGNAVRPYPAMNQQHNRHPSATPASCHPPSPSQSQPGSTPRSTPAAGQFRKDEQNLQYSPRKFAAPGVFPAPAPAASGFSSTGGLLKDIAETVQAVFPYAQVAARHGLSPAKVAEVLSGAVVTPLLRGATRPPGQG